MFKNHGPGGCCCGGCVETCNLDYYSLPRGDRSFSNNDYSSSVLMEKLETVCKVINNHVVWHIDLTGVDLTPYNSFNILPTIMSNSDLVFKLHDSQNSVWAFLTIDGSDGTVLQFSPISLVTHISSYDRHSTADDHVVLPVIMDDTNYIIKIDPYTMGIQWSLNTDIDNNPPTHMEEGEEYSFREGHLQHGQQFGDSIAYVSSRYQSFQPGTGIPFDVIIHEVIDTGTGDFISATWRNDLDYLTDIDQHVSGGSWLYSLGPAGCVTWVSYWKNNEYIHQEVYLDSGGLNPTGFFLPGAPHTHRALWAFPDGSYATLFPYDDMWRRIKDSQVIWEQPWELSAGLSKFGFSEIYQNSKVIEMMDQNTLTSGDYGEYITPTNPKRLFDLDTGELERTCILCPCLDDDENIRKNLQSFDRHSRAYETIWL